MTLLEIRVFFHEDDTDLCLFTFNRYRDRRVSSLTCQEIANVSPKTARIREIEDKAWTSLVLPFFNTFEYLKQEIRNIFDIILK